MANKRRKKAEQAEAMDQDLGSAMLLLLLCLTVIAL